MSTPANATLREFRFNGATLADPDPSLPAETVRELYAGAGYPTLTNASVDGPKREGDRDVYEFKAAVGRKG